MPCRSKQRKPAESTELTRRLGEAVRKGQRLICSGFTPEQLKNSKNEHHIIPAELIRDLLHGQSGEDPAPLGVRVTAARITVVAKLGQCP